MGEGMLHISTPNFIAVSQMVYDNGITKNFQTKSKLYIPSMASMLLYGGIKIYML